MERGHAAATVHRQVKYARQFFGVAVKQKLISTNPFTDVKAKNYTPTDRLEYIPCETIHKIIEHANPTWRTILALARFAGLRCPTEVCSLRWEHINLAEGRMTVSSPKTEHLEGKAYRIVPIFAELRRYLEEAYELAEPGEVFVVGGPQGEVYRQSAALGWKGTNLRTTFAKLIRRAGVKEWPKPFHNLRASCETDLMHEHPIHVVTAWLGNTPKIAISHYLQTQASDFEKAICGKPKCGTESGLVMAQNAAQSEANMNDQEYATMAESAGNIGKMNGSGRLCPLVDVVTSMPCGSRTHNRRLRRALLYPVELQDQVCDRILHSISSVSAW